MAKASLPQHPDQASFFLSQPLYNVQLSLMAEILREIVIICDSEVQWKPASITMPLKVILESQNYSSFCNVKKTLLNSPCFNSDSPIYIKSFEPLEVISSLVKVNFFHLITNEIMT